MAMNSPPAPLAGAPSGNGKITREAVLAATAPPRRLARALDRDRDPMILYRARAGKAALLDGVAATVLAQLGVDPADPTGAGQLRAVASANWDPLAGVG